MCPPGGLLYIVCRIERWRCCFRRTDPGSTGCPPEERRLSGVCSSGKGGGGTGAASGRATGAVESQCLRPGLYVEGQEFYCRPPSEISRRQVVCDFRA